MTDIYTGVQCMAVDAEQNEVTRDKVAARYPVMEAGHIFGASWYVDPKSLSVDYIYEARAVDAMSAHAAVHVRCAHPTMELDEEYLANVMSIRSVVSSKSWC